MKIANRAITILLILLTCIGCDQVTKDIAKTYLPRAETISFLGDTFRLQYAENQGGFLSLGASIPESIRFPLFVCLVAGSLLFLLVYLIRSRKIETSTFVALSFILAGGTGNLIDRIFNNGRVIDFMNMGIGPIRTGVFNIADIAITLGTFWLVLLLVRPENKDKKTL